MKSIQDPITMELMWQRVINIAEEGWVIIWRTSFSVVQQDKASSGKQISFALLEEAFCMSDVKCLRLPLTSQNLLLDEMTATLNLFIESFSFFLCRTASAKQREI